jgi:hypothetical protein
MDDPERPERMDPEAGPGPPPELYPSFVGFPMRIEVDEPPPRNCGARPPESESFFA